MKKNCRQCGKLKFLSDFYRHPQMFDGHLNVCKECKKAYERTNENYKKYEKTEKGLIRVIYKTQKRHSKVRGHEAPKYSKEELGKWLYQNNFKSLFDAWVKTVKTIIVF